jgi:hypothetical protein
MMIFLSISALESLFGVRIQGNPLLVLLVMLAAIPSIYGLGLDCQPASLPEKQTRSYSRCADGDDLCGITHRSR